MSRSPAAPRREPPAPPRAALTLPLVPLEGIGPVGLADLILSCPLRRRANLVVLQPNEDSYALLIKRGSLTLGAFQVSVKPAFHGTLAP